MCNNNYMDKRDKIIMRRRGKEQLSRLSRIDIKSTSVSIDRHFTFFLCFSFFSIVAESSCIGKLNSTE